MLKGSFIKSKSIVRTIVIIEIIIFVMIISFVLFRTISINDSEAKAEKDLNKQTKVNSEHNDRLDKAIKLKENLTGSLSLEEVKLGEFEKLYEDSKKIVAKNIGAESWEEVIYTTNSTYALNVLSQSIWRTGILKK